MLQELMEFMEKHRITFVRSASSNHELVLSHQTDDGFIHYIFDEECGDTDILYERYTKQTYTRERMVKGLAQ